MNLETHIKADLWKAVASNYGAGNYAGAILDGMHHLSAFLRDRTGLDGDGQSLVGQVLGGDTPRLRLNKLQTETEKNVQKGVELILKGLYMAVRNPRSHEVVEDKQETADAILYFLSHMLDILGQSKEPFTVQDFIARVLDPDFVPSNRYAQLLVAEIPAKKRLDILIEVYRRKEQGDGRKLSYMVHELIANLSRPEIEEFLAVVSDELKVAQADAVIRIVLQILPAEQWPLVNEAARMRVEHKLVRSVREGRFTYAPGRPRVASGSLGTWSSTVIAQFTLKQELRQAVLDGLQSEEGGCRHYAAHFFLESLPQMCTASWHVKEFVDAIAKAVRAGDSNVKDALLASIADYPSDWQDGLLEALRDLTDVDNPAMYLLPNRTPFLSASLGEDEIPF